MYSVDKHSEGIYRLDSIPSTPNGKTNPNLNLNQAKKNKKPIELREQVMQMYLQNCQCNCKVC